ncbi:receptor-type tyrosine-protein phosphatase F-like [Actinia tenebrosa]|uniref:protein-tyrosine-phosphatase n=1 Tax=Actinia tenebrosa TaxID=6105 RepID=A0A6P8H512_ACTTE|nr:receptor-type tyrosine-protein phosphatase F-like [Actinia tenebrosa]
MKTIAVLLKMKEITVCLLLILSIVVSQSSNSNVSNTINAQFTSSVIGQVGVTTTAAAAEDKRKSISSSVEYSTSTMTVTSSSPMDLVSTSSSLSDFSVKTSTSTPGLDTTVLRMTSTADPSAPTTLTQAMTSAAANKTITSAMSSVEATKATQVVTSSSVNESNKTDKSTTTPLSVTSESESVTPVMSRTATKTTQYVTSTPESKRVTPVVSYTATKTTHYVTSTPESKRVTPVVSPTATKTTHYVTSTPESKRVTPVMSHIVTSATKSTAQSETFVPASESVTVVVSNETSKTTESVTSKAITFSVASSFISTFVTTFQRATEIPSRFTVSINANVTDVPSVTVTTSTTAIPVTSTLAPNKSVTTSYSVSEAISRPSVTKTTDITSSVAIVTSVTHSSTVATSTQPPTTIPSTTTKPTTKPQVAPEFKTPPPNNKTVKEGETLVLTCTATGTPTPVITWKKEKIKLQNTSSIVISWDKSKIKILRTTREDEGTYQCNASNGVGRGVEAGTKVKISYFSGLQVKITEPDAHQSIREGVDVILTCSVDAYPRPFFTWKKDDKEDGVELGSRQDSNGSRRFSDLYLPNISRKNGGNYTCLAYTGTDLLGNANKMLNVELSLVPTYPPSNAMKTTDHTITIHIHKIEYLGNGKRVSYIQVIVKQLKNQTLPTRQPSHLEPSELGPYSKNRTELYIAAVILLKDIGRGPTRLVLGDESMSYTPTKARSRRNPREEHEQYYNAPLLPETYYTAFQRMMSKDKYHESLGWITATKTTTQSQVVDDSDLSTILWIVCVSLIVLIILIVVMSVYIINKKKTHEIDIDDGNSGKNAFGKMARSLSIHMARLHEHYHPSGPIPVENFAHHVARMHKSGDMHFSTEYERIPEYDSIPATHSIDPANQWKNRYSNIVAYDYNRVKLIPYDDEPASDYINASYITGYNNENTYIAAQGPLDETCGDFWRMIWEQNTRVIVMLTNVRERGRLKCSQYWPTSGKSRYEVIYVSLEDVVELTSYTIRVFRVAMTGQKETRMIKQFHFTGWPDHGVPKSATFLLAFVRQTAKMNPPDAGPMVVHCSAGVGRTGTFIVIDTMLQQIAQEKTVDILNCVTQLRKQRNLMVQTEQQYIFIHDALLDVIISGDTEIHASNLRKHVQEMIEPFKETGETKMALEFQRLSRGVRPHYTITAATTPANKSKNRYANTLPYDDTRVPLVVQTAVNGSDYVNANYIDAYMKKRAFIATQAPLPETFDDFWRMIWEQKCYTIVVLAQEMENDKLKMNRYWPTTHPITFGVLQVAMLEEEKKEYLETRVFNITNTMDNSCQIVHQFHYTAWTSEDLTDSGINILSMIEQIQQWQNASGNHVITVHCSAGVGRTGVFCAVSSLIERLKAEAVVDVFQTVKQLREQRPAMVQTKSQYEFCYRILLEYLDTHTSLEELDSSPALSQSYNTGNPPESEKTQNEISEQSSLESAKSNGKSNLVDSGIASDSLSEVKQKNSPNHIVPSTDTSENFKQRDVTPEDKAQVNVTPKKEGLENVCLEVTLENGVSQQNATRENITQKDISTENNRQKSVTLEDDVTLENTAHEGVTEHEFIQDITPETHQKADDEPLANSQAVLRRADSEESDPYVSPLSSSLNLNGY